MTTGADGPRFPIRAVGRFLVQALDRRRRLARGRATLTEVLTQLPGAPPGGWHVFGGHAASGSRVVFRVGAGTDRVPLIVTIGSAERDRRALRTAAGVLRSLALDPRLAGWRAVVPRMMAEGELDAATYIVQEAMPGTRPVWHDIVTRRALADRAADLVAGLHRATAEPEAVDEALVENWVRTPLRAIVAALDGVADPAATRDRASRLEDELSGALVRGPLTSSIVHGDYWPGNLLEEDGRLTAILDWDSSERRLGVVDLVHLLLHLRRGSDARSIGEVVAEILSTGRWDEHEAAILDRTDPGELDRRSTILLYWLGFAAGNLRRHPGNAGSARWLRRNVSVVLESATGEVR